MNAAQIRMRARLRNLETRYSGTPEFEELIDNEAEATRIREARSEKVNDLVHEHIVIDPIEDESLDGGRMTCTFCGMSSDHESMAAAGAAGWLHAQGCGGQR